MLILLRVAKIKEQLEARIKVKIYKISKHRTAAQGKAEMKVNNFVR